MIDTISQLMLEHPWPTIFSIIGYMFIVVEFIHWFLGTGKIGKELELIRKILASKNPK